MNGGLRSAMPSIGPPSAVRSVQGPQSAVFLPAPPMPLLEAVRLALQQIRVQKLKSFFTVLGVLIGVMFLIAVISIVQGMSNYMENDFAGKLIGGNTFTVRRFNFIGGDYTEEQWRKMQRWPRIYAADVQIMRDALPPGTQTAIASEDRPYAVTPYARRRQVNAVATDGDYFRIKKYDLSSGRAFTPQEAELGSPVVVIGDEIARDFFPNLNPVGREIRIGGLPYTVIGVIAKQGNVFGFSLDRLTIAPFNSPMRRVTNPRGDVDGLIVQAPTREMLMDLQEIVRETMRSHRGLGPGEEDDFSFETSDSALQFFEDIKGRCWCSAPRCPPSG
jgi:putative ABC transport system permease protein